MSLQVWLPLTKDLRNQGLSNVTVTNNGATFNSAGKLGGCYYFNGSSTLIFPSYNTTRSIAFWIKAPKTNSTIAFVDYKSKLGFGFQANGYIIPNCADSSLKMYAADNFIANEWNHIVVTRDDDFTDVTLYINGTLQTSRTNGTNTWNNSVDGCYIGGRSTGTNMTCYINDFRVYDHCLSPMEVKELSKGLVLHYPLNRGGWGQENLFVNSNFSKGTNSWYGVNSSSIRVETIDGKTCGTGTKGTTANILGQTCGSYAGSNATVDITVSAKIYVTEAGTFNVGHWITTTQASGWQGMSASGGVVWGGDTSNGTLQTGWNYITNTWKGAKNQYTGSIVTAFSYTGTTFWITDVKFEFGDKATPWCPNSSDALATTMGLNGTTEYDCSGFCNNGTRTGTFSWTSDTPKYSVSQYFTDYTRYITTSLSGWTPSSITLSCWIKSTNKTPRGNWHIPLSLDGQKAEISIGTTGKARIGFTIGGTRYVYDWGNDILNGTWHLITNVFDGNSMKMYIDGVLINSSNVSGTLQSINNLYVGRFNGVDTYGNTQLYESDVRIYATALSADDVQSLYQNSAYIDSSGNVYGAVHSEV